jgi:hypothetical protein
MIKDSKSGLKMILSGLRALKTNGSNGTVTGFGSETLLTPQIKGI